MPKIKFVSSKADYRQELCLLSENHDEVLKGCVCNRRHIPKRAEISDEYVSL